jgi:parvulin-like peptidyl-prolyl isomerase
MLIDSIRKKMKIIIWFIVVAFVLSVFFIGAAGFLDNLAAKKRMQQQTPQTAESIVNPDMDLTSTEQIGKVQLNDKSSVITMGTLNRRLLETGFTPDKMNQFPEFQRTYVKKALAERLVSEELMALEAESKKIDVDAKVLSQVESMKQRMGGEEIFLSRLKSYGYNDEAQFRSYLKKSLQVQELREQLFDGIKVTDQDLEFYYKSHNDEFKDKDGNVKPLDEVKGLIRAKLKSNVTEEDLKAYYEEHKARWMKPRVADIRYLYISKREPKNLEAIKSAVTDEELKAYYEANKNDYLAPEKAEVAHIYLDKEAMRAQVKEDKDALQKWYEDNKERYKTSEMVKASHILVKADSTSTEAEKKAALEKVQGIKKDILTGKITFEAAAKKYSEDKKSAEENGSLGEFARGEMVDEFEEYSFGGPVNVISEPVKTQYGYHLIRVEKQIPAGYKTLEEVHDRAFDAWREQVIGTMADAKIALIRKQLEQKTKSFEMLVKEYSMAPSKDKDGVLGTIYLGEGNAKDSISEISSGTDSIDYPILAMLRTLKVGQVSDMVETSGGYHILKINNKFDPEVKPYDDVKDQVKKDHLDKKLESLYEERIKTVKDSITKEGADFAAIASANTDSEASAGELVSGLVLDSEASQSVVTSTIIAELGFGSNVSSTVVEHIRYSNEGIISEPLDFAGRTYWFSLVKMHAPEYEPYVKVQDDVRAALTLNVTKAEIDDYYAENKEKYAVKPKIVLQQILYKDEQTAKDQLAAINKGLPFDKAGMSHLNMDRATFENTKGRVELDNVNFFGAAEQAEIMKLNKDQVLSHPVKSGIGWHVVKMAEKQVARQMSADEVSEQIISALKEKKKETVFTAYLEELRNRAQLIEVSL